MTVIPFKKPDNKCSFCGALESKVKHMFGNGEGKYICNHCIAHAKKRIEETNDNNALCNAGR